MRAVPAPDRGLAILELLSNRAHRSRAAGLHAWQQLRGHARPHRSRAQGRSRRDETVQYCKTTQVGVSAVGFAPTREVVTGSTLRFPDAVPEVERPRSGR